MSQINELRDIAESFLSQDSLLAHMWLALLGHMSSQEKLVPYCHIHMRSLQFQLKNLWSPTDNPCLSLPITHQIREDLAWWLDTEFLQLWFPLSQVPPEMLLFSDASVEWWGAHLQDLIASGTWPQVEKCLHINLLGMCAILLGSTLFSRQIDRPYHGVDEWQHLISSILQQRRRDNLAATVPLCQTGPSMGRIQFCDPCGLLHTGSIECSSGSAQSSGSGHRHRVVSSFPKRSKSFSDTGTPLLDLCMSALNKKLSMYCSLLPYLMA